jgi:hypothetical protein
MTARHPLRLFDSPRIGSLLEFTKAVNSSETPRYAQLCPRLRELGGFQVPMQMKVPLSVKPLVRYWPFHT